MDPGYQSAPSCPKGSISSQEFPLLGATWVILDAILESAGHQGLPKIKPSGTLVHRRVQKWGPRQGLGKLLKIGSEFNLKMEAVETPKY